MDFPRTPEDQADLAAAMAEDRAKMASGYHAANLAVLAATGGDISMLREAAREDIAIDGPMTLAAYAKTKFDPDRGYVLPIETCKRSRWFLLAVMAQIVGTPSNIHWLNEEDSASS